MNSYYEKFLKRLSQYRLRLNMTQEMTSELLGITQSQLSKQELGKTIVPFKSLVVFKSMGWDVDYLLTGETSKYETSELTEILKRAETNCYKPMLEFITWALAMEIEKSVPELSLEEKCELSILKMKSGNEANDSIMYEIRKITGEAQISMADKLGVNIKKYRALEKAQIYPDTELLLGIYQTTGCKPSLFLETEHIENVIIDHLWSRIDPERRKAILTVIPQIDIFIKT